MTLLLAFDCETTGIFEWKLPSDDPCQPHLVQIGAVLVDEDTRLQKTELNEIIRPDGWEWDETCEAFQVHGITFERAMDEGIPEAEALDMFIELYRQAPLRISHNTTFDNRAIRCALKRYRPDLISDDEWKDKSRYYCTLINSRKAIGGKSGHTLSEMYEYFTGNPLEDAHNALADTRACLEIYWHLQELAKAA